MKCGESDLAFWPCIDTLRMKPGDENTHISAAVYELIYLQPAALRNTKMGS